MPSEKQHDRSNYLFDRVSRPMKQRAEVFVLRYVPDVRVERAVDVAVQLLVTRKMDVLRNRQWADRHKNDRYVPPELLKAWGIFVEVRD